MKTFVHYITAFTLIALVGLSFHAKNVKRNRVSRWIAEHQKHLAADKAWGGSYNITIYK